jgi:hypothetical protein
MSSANPDSQPDVCPECGDDYISMSKCDFRPEGALFEDYVHSYQSETELIVDESCTHVLEWGEETDHE